MNDERFGTTEEGSRQIDAEWLVNQVAHALRNPIFAATLQAETLALQYGDPEVFDMLRQLEALGHIVEDMLLYGRPVTPNPTALEAESFLESVVQDHRAGNGHEPAEIELRMGAPGLEVRWDKILVRAILDKVLTNAVQHTAAPHRITVAVNADGSTVRMEVADDGEGIDPELADRIFLPFTPQHHGRPGLGLAIARKLCRAMGGFVSVASERGRGTTVTIVLPREAVT